MTPADTIALEISGAQGGVAMTILLCIITAVIGYALGQFDLLGRLQGLWWTIVDGVMDLINDRNF